MGTVIQDIAYHLPAQVVTNEELAQAHPDWDMGRVGRRAGVQQRHIVADGQTALDLAVPACQQLFQNHPELRDRVDGLIFCTQTADHPLPGNASVLHGMLDLPERVLAFDIDLACSGYVYGLAIARGLIQSGMATNILMVNADTYSKYIHKEDRSSRVLFGDGAAVSWISPSDGDTGVLDVECATHGAKYASFWVEAGGCRVPNSAETAESMIDDSGNVRTRDCIQMGGMEILNFVTTKVPAQIKNVLEKNSLTTADIDLFVFHQASRMAIDSITRLLRLPAEKVFTNIERVGNTVSASIPIALKDAMQAGVCPAGSRIILSGFGAGLSWATALYQV